MTLTHSVKRVTKEERNNRQGRLTGQSNHHTSGWSQDRQRTQELIEMTDVGTNGGAVGIQLPKIKFTTQIPDSARGRGRVGGGENVYQKLMIDMPAPAPGKGKGAPVQYASFFVPTEVPDTITDPDERTKAAKDSTGKLVNRFTSVSRRIRKAHGATHDYTFRKTQDPETGEWGVMVYRIEPGAPKLTRKAA